MVSIPTKRAEKMEGKDEKLLTEEVTQDFTAAVKDDVEEDDDDAVAFASVDLSGVDFDRVDLTHEPQARAEGAELKSPDTIDYSPEECDLISSLELGLAFPGLLPSKEPKGHASPLPADDLDRFETTTQHLLKGEYIEVLESSFAMELFSSSWKDPCTQDSATSSSSFSFVADLQQRLWRKGSSWIHCLEMQLIGIAALNLFLQGNYTGPAFLEDSSSYDRLNALDPHPCFAPHFLGSPFSDGVEAGDTSNQAQNKSNPSSGTRTLSIGTTEKAQYQNAVLAYLAMDGDWPCQVSSRPYFLLLARTILQTLADPSRPHQGMNESNEVRPTSYSSPPDAFIQACARLTVAHLWSGRAVVAHQRLLQAREPSLTLWREVEAMYTHSLENFSSSWKSMGGLSSLEEEGYRKKIVAVVQLEWGLAQHHFDRPGNGRSAFAAAQQNCGLLVEVTGSQGRRTKYQQQATAQMIVRASSSTLAPSGTAKTEMTLGSKVEHPEDGILLERIRFEDEADNLAPDLSILDQTILLALCLDVKSSNPNDGLTAEEMGAYLARVLDHHQDWMVYSTALLERAWLEFDRTHARERALLQLQALLDQHTQRLTLTQSTQQSIDESAPVPDRLKNLHSIVYPPRWEMIQDLADRYARLGIVTSAAELFTEIEYWDEVVECYRRAGRLEKAKEIVTARLSLQETPRMWSALGDLTGEHKHYLKAIELSKGRFVNAYISLGMYYYDANQLELAAQNYESAVKIRPLATSAWFRLGTIYMRLDQWENALRAFSEVVQQEPEEADAWANVAAIHMHNKHPSEAYPALREALKQNRNNWRVWESMLYTCLDLNKFDEAIQAANMLLDLKISRIVPENIPLILTEKVLRAIVAGTLNATTADITNQQNRNDVSEAGRRTLYRVLTLLDRVATSSEVKPWVFELMAFLYEQIGHGDKVLEMLLNEYRALQSIPRWANDTALVTKICQVVGHCVAFYRQSDDRSKWVEARYLMKGVLEQVEAARGTLEGLPYEVGRLKELLQEIEVNQTTSCCQDV